MHPVRPLCSETLRAIKTLAQVQTFHIWLTFSVRTMIAYPPPYYDNIFPKMYFSILFNHFPERFIIHLKDSHEDFHLLSSLAFFLVVFEVFSFAPVYQLVLYYPY